MLLVFSAVFILNLIQVCDGIDSSRVTSAFVTLYFVVAVVTVILHFGIG